MEQMMVDGPEDIGKLIGLGGADHSELNPRVTALKKVCDVCLVGDRIDATVGVARSPSVDLAVEGFPGAGAGSPFADG